MHSTISSHDQSPSSSRSLPVRLLPDPVRGWTGPSTEYPRTSTLSSVFEEVAREYRDAVALVQDQHRLTYGDLNKRANHLAHLLRRAGVKPEIMVGCYLDRSIEMIVAVLAILKAGGAYVPLDPAYPKARLDFILQDTGYPLILTRKSLSPSLPQQYSNRIVWVDDREENSSLPKDERNPQPTASPQNLAYVMYTSGSTGQPKGVMVEHRGILRLVRGTDYCHFGPDETFLQFAPGSFDASTFEIWGALLNGGRLVLMPSHSSSLEDLVRAVQDHGVTTLWLTAGLFHLLVEQYPDGLRTLRQLLAGGDVLSARHVRQFLEHSPRTTLINGYGPTENTTFTCCQTVRAGDPVPESVPIGKPIPNTRVYLLDDHQNPVLPGETGELYAAGDGVARGYLNAPEATANQFLVDPFTDEVEQRMYKTGDLACWRPDGTIEFLGRADNQVKILGHRIEPAEIEAVLQRHPQVKQACVVARVEHDGAKRLVAYFVPTASDLSPEELRKFVAADLPQHMVPAFFVSVAALPLSDHGKVDRAALAKLAIVLKTWSPPSSSSGNELECAIGELWQRILKVPKVGLDDNFFDLGGDSLLLVAVHSNLQKLLQRELALTDLFEFTTIRKLAKHLTQGEAAPVSADQERALRQREAFTKFRARRTGGEP